MSTLQGAAEFRARLKAIKTAFKPYGKDWAEETRNTMARSVPVRTGRLQRSFKVRNASATRASVAGHYTAFFVDKGTREHDEKPKTVKTLRFQGADRIVFTKRVRHPRTAAKPFRRQAAEDALRKRPLLMAVIGAWNAAGKRGRLNA